MKKNVTVRKLGHSRYRCVRRETFSVDGTRLIVEDRIPVLSPWRGERILRIAGTNAFYSAVPLGPARHRLLCYNYCEDALRAQRQRSDYYRHALVLGCGGGAVPGWLLGTYRSLSVDVVERSPEIIDVCRTYFLKRWERSDRLRYYCMDARDFKPPEYPYQFIFCDLFDGENLAPLVYNREFSEKLHDMLCGDGLLVTNCGLDELIDVQQVYRTLFRYLQIVERKSWQTQVIKASDCPF